MQRSPYKLVTLLDDIKVTALIERFTKAQSVEFRARYAALLRRKARTTHALVSAPTDQLEEAEAEALEVGGKIEDFEEEIVTKYVSLAERVETPDGTLQTGGEIVAMFAGDRGTIQRFFQAVAAVNTFSDEAKNAWRSQHDSGYGLAGPNGAAGGPKPGGAASDASRKGATSTAGAPVH